MQVFPQTLKGTSFADTLIGAAGLDTLLGGLGDDLYLMASSADHGGAEITDIGGSDELRFTSTTAGQTMTLFAGDTGLERVVIGVGTDSVANSSATTALGINAQAAPNGLWLVGNAGNNTLTGSAFIDTLEGGLGNDLYVISGASHHSAAEINDSAAEGDELRFTATVAGQTLTVFAGDLGLERVTIGSGTATTPVTTGTAALHVNAAAAPNGLTLTGNNGANTLNGSAFADTLRGNGGNDTLVGGPGHDTLIGGDGADVFRFDAPLDATTNVDHISEFSLAQADVIQLENAVFTALSTVGALASTAFFPGSVATTADHRILHDVTAGSLFYDPDGTGPLASTPFATLSGGLALTASRFTVT